MRNPFGRIDWQLAVRGLLGGLLLGLAIIGLVLSVMAIELGALR